ncbi:MAG: sensor histidine kinase [Rhodanobacter sp.]|nr:MAG: sensor histidine kinase [Rhodanobacter sp.]TAM11054.1 MAG: sensor histidine kinase [Rhodanobacter sp.]TAM35547.1 MAG: sensor histidine kinase [Rhodanobacter sp.]
MKRPLRRPSLRRRLLGFLLIPVAVLLLLDMTLTYAVALGYANHVHDRDLAGDALTLAKMMGNEQLGGELSPQARFLLQYDPSGEGFFSVVSRQRGLLAGNDRLPAASPPSSIGSPPTLFDTHVGKHALRAVTLTTRAPNRPGDELVITVAETLHDRHMQARNILLLAIATEAPLVISVLLLVWFGVNHGLRVLDPLTERLARRNHELSPIGAPDVPQEILPLTRTIDALFSRLRSMLALHDRFIADAAHQLRTPLAGLSLHVERALAASDPASVHDALAHIRDLTRRTARTTAQLLSLTRAQAPSNDTQAPAVIDLAQLIPDAVGQRVHEALEAGVDLGYQCTEHTLSIRGHAASVLDLLDNLIDNAIRYAGRGSIVTVSLQRGADDGACLTVEDNGPGVPPELLPRLSERFFRAPETHAEGSGLGLAIVQRIVERHHAEVVYELAEEHGLRVTVRFPPVHDDLASAA